MQKRTAKQSALNISIGICTSRLLHGLTLFKERGALLQNVQPATLRKYKDSFAKKSKQSGNVPNYFCTSSQ
jgi:hypothetical protein